MELTEYAIDNADVTSQLKVIFMTALVNLLQIEYVRQGTRGYKPNRSKPFIDISAAGTQSIDTEFSDHATNVAQLWQDHGGIDLVNNWYISEAVCWEIQNLRAGKTLSPIVGPNVHLVIAPYGMSATWTGTGTYGSCTKLQQWAQAQNALVLKSPPDAGQGFYQSPCQAVGDNILTVASSTTGSNMTNQPAVDLYYPQDWNSYAQPAMLAAGGLLQLFDFLLRNIPTYKASDIRGILIDTALKDSVGRPILNSGAALAAIKSQYGFIQPPPPPPPATVQEITTASPQPPSDTTTSQPAPTPSTTTYVGSPHISSFNHGVSSAWTSPNTPTTFYFNYSNADSVTLVDPKGRTLDVTGKTSQTVTGVYSGGNTWMLKANNPNGVAVLSETAVHGCIT